MRKSIKKLKLAVTLIIIVGGISVSAQDTPDDHLAGDGENDTISKVVNEISLSQSPIKELKINSVDGNELTAVYRKPPGLGPFPTYVYTHGGFRTKAVAELKDNLYKSPVFNGLVRAGFCVVLTTFRDYEDVPLSKGPILDTLGFFEAVRTLPFVEYDSIIVSGGSGGGNFVLELAGIFQPAVVVAGEPASVIYTGMYKDQSLRRPIMEDYEKFWNEEVELNTLLKLKAIKCPVLILHGDVHPLKYINGEKIQSLMRIAGVEHKYMIFEGEPHGFYWGHRTSVDTSFRVVEAIINYAEPHIFIQPVTWDVSLNR
jgi:dipeptidyl aminopeptidase/acylaminoacyl peptidase